LSDAAAEFRSRRLTRHPFPGRSGRSRIAPDDIEKQRHLRAGCRGTERGPPHAVQARRTRRRADHLVGGDPDHFHSETMKAMSRLGMCCAVLMAACTAAPQPDDTAAAAPAAEAETSGAHAAVVPGLEVLLSDSALRVSGGRDGVLTIATAVR